MRLASGETRWVVLAQCDGQRVLFLDPLAQGGGRPTIEPLATFAELWTGELILATSQASLAGELAKFDFSTLTNLGTGESPTGKLVGVD
ncbi:MAG: hypothetical protein RLZZ584_4157 [Pseudomonadota bacterium]